MYYKNIPLKSWSTLPYLVIVSFFVFACSNVRSSRKIAQKKQVDSAVVNNPNLFKFGVKVIDLNTEGGADSIEKSLEKIKNIRGIDIKVESQDLTIYADSFDVYKEVFSSIRKAGYTLDDLFTMAGPGISCDIPSENQDKNDSVEIIQLANSISSFKEEFNKNKDKVRVISIPNPSCLACVKGQRYINSLFTKELKDYSSVIGLAAWISVEGWGDYTDAQRLAPEIKDSRVKHFWDPNMRLGKLFKKPLGFENGYPTAWDVYMIYEKNITWDNEVPPSPTFWMHQVSNEESGLAETNFLDKLIFTQKLKAIISD
jgi:copper chaperone CopZ